ncbi:MAG: hypothetical protein E6J71_01830 [Deltaproteobacteria bacterium]|nr:MAG: hypothetical protein E6J71_01830 [Deltaproteobacteria bacterium]
MTVLFADVQGSMELAAQVDQNDWRLIMDRFFAILAFMREGNDAAALGMEEKIMARGGAFMTLQVSTVVVSGGARPAGGWHRGSHDDRDGAQRPRG